MNATHINIPQIAESILARSHHFVLSWLPNGKIYGDEYKVGSLEGDPGRSLSINLKSGLWKDFGDDQRGGRDLVSLYAAINRVGQYEAAKALMDQIGLEIPRNRAPENLTYQREKALETLIAHSPYACIHSVSGRPKRIWDYYDIHGNLIGHVARYEQADDKGAIRKTYRPWRFTQFGWVSSQWPDPRPMYGLELLNSNPDSAIMIVEGEKAADAARVFAGNKFVVISWPGGSGAVHKVDWSPIYSRKRIVLWPDADTAGHKAMVKLRQILLEHVSHVQILDTSGLQEKSDAADMRFTSEKEFLDFIQSRIDPNDAPKETTAIDPRTIPWMAHLELDRGKPLCVYKNVEIILNNMLYGKIAYNEMSRRIECMESDDHIGIKKGEWTESSDAVLYKHIDPILKKTPPPFWIHKIICQMAEENRVNPLQEHLKSLVWDGVHRLDTWLSDYAGAEDNAYTRMIGKKWLVSAIARAMKPGCKVDHMLVLYGREGLGKSTLFEIIGGEWYLPNLPNVECKDARQTIIGHWIVVSDELDSLMNSRSTSVKSFLTTQKDVFRPAYGRSTISVDRTSVIAGTTDNKTFMNNEENRRFWPVEVHDINIRKLRYDRALLLAEALHCYELGESWHIENNSQRDLCREHVDSYRDQDPFEELLDTYLEQSQEPIKVSEFLSVKVGIPLAKITRKDQLRVSQLLKKRGFEHRQISVKGRKVWVYMNGETACQDV
jgi:predicted P-loop ATPase